MHVFSRLLGSAADNIIVRGSLNCYISNMTFHAKVHFMSYYETGKVKGIDIELHF